MTPPAAYAVKKNSGLLPLLNLHILQNLLKLSNFTYLSNLNLSIRLYFSQIWRILHFLHFPTLGYVPETRSPSDFPTLPTLPTFCITALSTHHILLLSLFLKEKSSSLLCTIQSTNCSPLG